MIRRLLTAALAAVAAAGGLVLGPAAPAVAASCTDPVVVRHAPLTYAGQKNGYVDLEYSVACHSARAHVHSIYVTHPGVHAFAALLERTDGSAGQRCVGAAGTQDCRTPWLYDRDPYQARAQANVDLYPSGGHHLAQGITRPY